ncbi:MAG: hypothetical protein RRY06_09755, partial [Lachnospiraceae bacterium]
KSFSRHKKVKIYHENLTKWQTRQSLYFLSLTGILYYFCCNSQDISPLKMQEKIQKIFKFPINRVDYSV